MASSCAAGATGAEQLALEAEQRAAWCAESVAGHYRALQLARWARDRAVQPAMDELWERYAAAARRAGAACSDVPGSVVARRLDAEARALWARWAERQLPVEAPQLEETVA